MKSVLKNMVVTVITWEAKMLLKRTKPKIVAVTGSVGKTSTKDAIFHILKEHKRARKSEKSFNSDIGVPLSILGLSNGWDNPFLWFKNIFDGFLMVIHPGDYPEILVLEMGVDRPGDMKKLVEWVRPDVVVLTRLPDVPAHVEYFASPDLVIEEKKHLIDALKPDGILVFNNDDEKVRQIAEGIRQQSIGFGRYSETHFHAHSDEVIYLNDEPVGIKFKMAHIRDDVDFSLNGVVGVQAVYTAAAATATASIFDVPLEAAAADIASYTPPQGRMRIIKGLKDSIILDDTYNSSPVAAERALSSLFELKTRGRKIAVLGDMLELGRFSVEEHEKVGEQAAEGVDILFTVGVRARGIALGAMNTGLSEADVYQYDEAAKAGKELQSYIKPGDVILIKGSQGMRMERIVKEIMAEPDKAEEFLVRQAVAWQAKA